MITHVHLHYKWFVGHAGGKTFECLTPVRCHYMILDKVRDARTPLKVGILELTNVSVEVLRGEGLEVRELDTCPIDEVLHCLHPRQISSHVSVTRLHILLPVVARALDAEDRLAPDGLRLNSNEKPHSQSKTMNSCIEIHQQHFQSGQVFQAKLQSKRHTR